MNNWKKSFNTGRTNKAAKKIPLHSENNSKTYDLKASSLLKKEVNSLLSSSVLKKLFFLSSLLAYTPADRVFCIAFTVSDMIPIINAIYIFYGHAQFILPVK